MPSLRDGDASTISRCSVGQVPSVIVTLVHGTFSPDAEWTRPGSTFGNKLKAGLAGLGRVHLRRFTWSGANNMFERLEAESALRQAISRVHDRFPEARHFIVAHSHGGNIASGLLAGDRQPGVTGIVCLATPFFHLRFREETLDPNLMSRSWIGILCLLAFAIGLAVQLSWWVQLLLVSVCVLLGGVIGAFLGAGLDVIAPPVREFVARTAPRRYIPLLNLRGAGDEAALALSFGQMIDWLCSSMHRRIVARAGRPRATVVPGRWGAISRLWAVCAVAALILAFEIYSVNGSLPAGAPWFAVIVTVATIGPFMIKTYWLDNLTLGILSLLLVGSTIFTKSWFGTAIPKEEGPSHVQRFFANLLLPMLLEIRTEAAPPGHSEVTYLPPAPLLPDPVEGRLTHGIYDHPAALARIVEWIFETTFAARTVNVSNRIAPGWFDPDHLKMAVCGLAGLEN